MQLLALQILFTAQLPLVVLLVFVLVSDALLHFLANPETHKRQ